MANERENLAAAFAVKEKNEKLLSNLDKLRDEGSVDSDLYLSMKKDYEQQLDASLQEIEQIQGYFKREADTSQLERDIYQRELAKLETRYKVGELSEDTYQSSGQNLRTTIGQLDQQIEEFRNFADAQSASDLGISVRKPAPPLEQAPPVAPTAPSEVPPPAEPPIPPAQPPTSPKPAPPVPPPTTAPSELQESLGKQRGLPQRKWLIIGGAVVVVVIIIVAALLLIPGGDTAITEVQIPVTVKGASNIGALHFELVYDANKLTLTSVNSGTLLNNAIFKYSSVPGRLVCGVVSSSGLQGDGQAVIIDFQVTETDTTTVPLVVENVAAYDGASLNKLAVSTLNGNLSPKDGSFTPPTLTFTAAQR